MNSRSWYAVDDHADVAVGRPHAYPLAHDLGRVEISSRVESQIVGSNDLTADRTDRGNRSIADIDGADLAAECLGDVEASIGSNPHAIGAEQRARLSELGQLPSRGDGCTA
jgi:hypothetical protein